jgi:hypothetical protein
MLPTQGPAWPVTMSAFSSMVSWATKAFAFLRPISQPPVPVMFAVMG